MSVPAQKVQSSKIITGKVRFCYVHAFEPWSGIDGQEPKYSICLLIRKDDRETLEKINNGINAAKENGKSLWGGKIPANLRLPLRDGDEERPDQEEFRGMFFLNASSRQKPGVIDRYKQPIEDPLELYSGCYGRASLTFFPYSQAGNRGIGVGLNNLQKLADGEPLGGRIRAEDEFDEWTEDEDDDLLG